VICYCVNKRKKEREGGMNNEWNSEKGGETGRNVELVTGETKKSYL
jgi:hypothetical protein